MSKRTRDRNTAAVASHNSSQPTAKIINVRTAQESHLSVPKQIYYDNTNEQLASSVEDEDQDENQDECAQLIACDSGKSLNYANESSLNVKGRQNGTRRHTNGKHHQAIFVHDDKTRNFLTRLGNLFAPTFTKSNRDKPHEVGLHDHKADFVYQSGWTEDDDEEQQAVAERGRTHINRAYQSSYDLNLPGTHYHHHNHQGSHWATGVRQRSLMPAVLFVLFLVGICVILFKLSSLIQIEKSRILENVSLVQQTRQELVAELTKQLDNQHQEDLELDKLNRWLVYSPKCQIPVLEPWDKSIESFVSTKPAMNCSAILGDILDEKEDSSGTVAKKWPGLLSSSLSYVDSNRLYFTEAALKLGALTNPLAPGKCCLKRISRVVENDDELEKGLCEPIIAQGLFINSSVIEVVCASWNYTNVHSFVVHNEEEEEALVRVANQKLNPDQDFYSVLMVGVDTISRLNGKRQLGKTLQILNDLYETIEFVGYNKVGENTFPNLIPLLTGLTPEQLTQIDCWQAEKYSENESGDDYLDNCKFLWNYFQQIGYLTYLGEDWPQASTFNYLKPGFKYEPTTFYGRPFTLARDHLIYPKFNSPGCASCHLDKPIVEVDLNNLKSFVENNINKLPYFAFHWINCPQHDDLNGASQIDHVIAKFFKDLKQQLDTDRTFVVFFSDHGYRWNDFVSTRVGHYESSLPMMTIAPPNEFKIRHPDLYKQMKSHQNSLLTPFDIFKTMIDLKNLSSKLSNSSTNVKVSQRQQFVTNKLEPMSLDNNVVILQESSTTAASTNTSPSTKPPTSVKQLKSLDGTTFVQQFKSLSLFDRHSSSQLDRNCIEAGIPDNYCVCHQFEPVDATRIDVLGAAYYLVYVHLESRLINHLDICSRLDLERVHHAELFDLERTSNTKKKTSARRRKRNKVVVKEDDEQDNDNDNDDDRAKYLKTSPKPARHLHGANDDRNKHDYLPNREYSIMFSTKPGGGLFQEVVRFYGSNMTNCELEIGKTRKVIEDKWATGDDKQESMMTMNDVCEFSVHTESLSRFNLYKDQSKCVKSNIELKKTCYCKDLINTN